MSLKMVNLPLYLTLPRVNELRDAYKIFQCYPLIVGTTAVSSPFQRPWDVESMFVDADRRARSPLRLYSARCIRVLERHFRQTACGSKNHAIPSHFPMFTFSHIAFLFISAPRIHPKSHNFAHPCSINCFCGRTLWDATSVAA